MKTKYPFRCVATFSALLICGSFASASDTNVDNSAVNNRDKSGATLTPEDQSNTTADTKITQRIREQIIKTDSLSVSAKNVKIITVGGKVTLRGPVMSEAEKTTIGNYANKVAGAAKVDNQLEVKTNK
ncbi:MAG: BON domain-containing protein [Chthoniobacterales bacterium]